VLIFYLCRDDVVHDKRKIEDVLFLAAGGATYLGVPNHCAAVRGGRVGVEGAWVSASWVSLVGMEGTVGHGCLLVCVCVCVFSYMHMYFLVHVGLFLIPNAEEDDSRKKWADVPSPTLSFTLSGGFRGVLLDR